jgi:hypothetical protein
MGLIVLIMLVCFVCMFWRAIAWVTLAIIMLFAVLIAIFFIGAALQSHPVQTQTIPYAGAVADPTPKPTPVSDDEIRAENENLLKRLRQEIAAQATPATNQQYKRPPTTKEMGMPPTTQELESMGDKRPPTTQEMGQPDQQEVEQELQSMGEKPPPRAELVKLPN